MNISGMACWSTKYSPFQFCFHTAYEIWHQSASVICVINSIPILFQVTMTEKTVLGDSFLTSVQNAAQMNPNLALYILYTRVKNRQTCVPTTVM